MPPVTRLGDVCTGHGGFPPRPNNSASGNVFANNIPVHRQGDHWITHCNSTPTCHDSNAAHGSSSVFANNRQVMRIGDPIFCGSRVAQGSGNVFAGG